MADVALNNKTTDNSHTRSNSKARLKVDGQMNYIHILQTTSSSHRAARARAHCMRAQHQLHIRKRREQQAALCATGAHARHAFE
eukprot:3496040-Pleurochrysis_carterae.AAC.3